MPSQSDTLDAHTFLNDVFTMSPGSSKLVRLFLTGLLAAFPLIATALLIAFVVGIVIRWLGPSSAVGSVMAKMGLGIAGLEWVGYVVGLAIVILSLLFLGLLVEKGLKRDFQPSLMV